MNVGTPSFNSGLTSQIIASGIGSSYSSTGSYGSITDFGGSSYSSGSSFSNVNSSLGSYLDPAFDFGVDQQLANGLRAYEQQQQEQISLTFFNQIVGPDLQGAAQAQVRHDNSVLGEFRQMANVGTSSAPLASDVRDVFEVATGRDAFSGEKLGTFQYATTIVGAALPFVSSKSLRELFSPATARATRSVSTVTPEDVRLLQLQESAARRNAPNLELNVDRHHLQTNKNSISSAGGGPFTPEFEKLAARRGTTLNNTANIVLLPGHQGPHPAYNAEVLRRMSNATSGLRGKQFNAAYDNTLQQIGFETRTPGTKLNKLATGKGN